MNKTHLKYLSCPACRNAENNLSINKIKEEVNDRIKDGSIICSCGCTYTINNYIVDFVTQHDETTINSHIYDTLWDLHKTQNYSGRVDEYSKKFQKSARLPGDLSSYFKDKIVFDAGCGEGRFTYLASSLGAKIVISVDYSLTALQRAIVQSNYPNNVVFIRGNLEQPPVAKVVDYAFSMGVLHHTPSTKKSFDKVVSTVVPGGYFSIYVYKKWSLPWIYWLVRPISLRINKNFLKDFCEVFGWGYNPNVRAIISLKKMFSYLGKFDILGLSRITFEGLTTPYLWEHSRKEVESWLTSSGFDLISSTDEVAASGRKKENI